MTDAEAHEWNRPQSSISADVKSVYAVALIAHSSVLLQVSLNALFEASRDKYGLRSSDGKAGSGVDEMTRVRKKPFCACVQTGV